MKTNRIQSNRKAVRISANRFHLLLFKMINKQKTKKKRIINNNSWLFFHVCHEYFIESVLCPISYSFDIYVLPLHQGIYLKSMISHFYVTKIRINNQPLTREKIKIIIQFNVISIKAGIEWILINLKTKASSSSLFLLFFFSFFF